MSCFGLNRRLLPSKKAIRGFTTLLKSNLHKLRRSKTVSTDFSVMRRRHFHRHLKGAHASAQSFSPVYIDELFRRQLAAEVNMKQRSEETPAAELGGVDLRAEMFIRKFKEEMKLQRQKSFGEYQEMIARGCS